MSSQSIILIKNSTIKRNFQIKVLCLSFTMEFTAENLEKAVTLFYRSEALQQAEAHQWLTEAQNSPQAWGFVWELLNPLRVGITYCKTYTFADAIFFRAQKYSSLQLPHFI